MAKEFLDFERPIAELEARIRELKHTTSGSGIDIASEITRLQEKSRELTERIFSKLSPSNVVQLARHPDRPHFVDIIENVFTDFDELHGDRHFSDDKAIIGGLARLNGQPVMVIGQEKGRETRDKVRHNFGMPKPEGYRKALRLMKMAERFQLPLLTFIDTPGAYPGIDAEERNQSEAIARNLFEMCQLKTPVISTILGEGGSGGALAIGVCDTMFMLEFSIYSVISPEGCATILWKSAERMADAATAMQLTAPDILAQGLVDGIIPEPLGGAHRTPKDLYAALEKTLVEELIRLQKLSNKQRLDRRYQRLMLRDHQSDTAVV